MEVLYIGSHEPSWLGRAGVPLFISHRRLTRLKRTLPKAIAPWALDSGSFSELALFGGWKTSAVEYVVGSQFPCRILKWDVVAMSDLTFDLRQTQYRGTILGKGTAQAMKARR